MTEWVQDMPRGECPSGGRQVGHFFPTLPCWSVLHNTVEQFSDNLKKANRQTNFSLISTWIHALIAWMMTDKLGKWFSHWSAAHIRISPQNFGTMIKPKAVPVLFEQLIKWACDVKGVTHSDKPTENYHQFCGAFWHLSVYCFGVMAHNIVLLHSHGCSPTAAGSCL